MSAIDFASIPAIRHTYSSVFFKGVDMRSFDVIVGPDTYDSDIRRIESLLGTRLEVRQEHPRTGQCGPMAPRETELRRQLAEILDEDIRFYQDAIATRR